MSVGVLSSAAAQGSLESLDPQVAYSATRSFSDGNMRMESAYNYAPGKHRTEMHIQGQSMVAIIREDLEVLWSLAPAHSGAKFYMEFSTQSDEARSGNTLVGTQIADSRLVGSEIVAGYSTSKYEVTIADPDGSTYSGNIWVTRERIPVRMEMTDGRGNQLILEQTDIEIGPQADQLFEVPAGYSKLEIGGIGSVFGNLSEGFAGARPATENSANDNSERDFGFVGDIAEHATDAAKQGVLFGVGEEVRDTVGGRIRGFFSRRD
jgi:outer membrane lipoprotein-sorting protein